MDQLVRSIDNAYSFRIFLIRTDAVVEEARKIHGLSKTATVALGRLLTANLLLAADLKNADDRMTLQIRGDGPGGMLITTADGDGHVKGYIENPETEVQPKENGSPNVAEFVGKEGALVIIRDYGMKEPYTAHSPLLTGEIAEDIAAYYYQTERIPTAVSLGVQLKEDGSVDVAGGFFLQAMPGVTDEEMESVESLLLSLPDITKILKGKEAEEILAEQFGEFKMEILDKSDVSYRCDCSREKVEDAISSLSVEELREMIEEDHGAEVVCHFCRTAYTFSEEDLESIISNK